MATLSSNRIPLHVNHEATVPGGSSYSTYRTTTTKSSGIDGGGGGEYHSAYDMRNVNDETDRIKNRMKEFEERCKKWREDFFSRTQTINNNDIHQSSTSSMFDHRAPYQDSSSSFQHASPLSSSTTAAAPPSFTSTMHKAYLEDLADGGKVYKIEFEIGDFNQNELFISTTNRALCVKGDRELKAGSATETKTFNREITLPDYVDLNNMKAYLLDKPSSPASRGSQTHLTTQSANNNVLIIEAPVLMDKYTYRRSAYNPNQNSHHHHHQSQSQSPTRPLTSTMHTSRHFSPPRTTSLTRTSISPNKKTVSESYHSENKSTTSSTSTTQTTKILNDNINTNFIQENTNGRTVYEAPGRSFSQPNLNQAIAPELIPGYPVYDNAEGCVIYKFDLTGFDQSEIHLTITVDRKLMLKLN
jgi:HSP20 family molecular chaperone IbpA